MLDAPHPSWARIDLSGKRVYQALVSVLAANLRVATCASCALYIRMPEEVPHE